MGNIYGVPKIDVARIWDQVRPWIDSALRHSGARGLTLEQILEGVGCDQYMLIIERDENEITGAATLERFEENGRVIMLIVTLATRGANEENEARFLQFVESLAIEYRCDCIQVRGRAGWARWLKPRGFEPVYKLIEKAVTA